MYRISFRSVYSLPMYIAAIKCLSLKMHTLVYNQNCQI